MKTDIKLAAFFVCVGLAFMFALALALTFMDCVYHFFLQEAIKCG